MNNQEVITTPTLDRSTWAANFHARVDRYKSLLIRKWWVPLLIIILAVAAQAALIHFAPPKYKSVGRMIVSIKLSIPETTVYNEELGNFLGTQAELMQSSVVISRAQRRVAAQRQDLVPAPVELRVSVQPRTSIFVLTAIGDDPDYTQAFLQACMDEYTNLKREMRTQTSDTTVAGLTAEVLRLEKELRKSDAEMVAFASSNSVVLLQDQGNNAATYLTGLNQRMAALRFEYELLKELTLDQNLDRTSRKVEGLLAADTALDFANPLATSVAPDGDYLKAKQMIILLKAEEMELREFLRPQHPKIIALNEEIARRERLLQIYRQQTTEELESKKSALAVQIQKLEEEVTDWEAKALEISRKSAEYQRLRANTTRIQALYDRLLATMQTLDVNKEINPESVTTMQPASPGAIEMPELTRKLPLAALVGLAVSIGLLMLIDRLDDRMNSINELSDLFEETVLAQVPREKAKGKRHELPLITPEDGRHGFVEAFRSMRSALLYLATAGNVPRTILLTSSVPNDGKSMTASNLAITLANAGSRVLLVDADLRKGVLHERLSVKYDQGLSDVLSHGLNWSDVVRPTSVPNLSLLPRGSATHKSSELFLSTATQKFLKDAAANYDYVLVDTAPVMAADDVTTLAPQVDGVIFVIRAEQTSARVARASLELLHSRRTRILGIVFNGVRGSSGYYYAYYKYKDYYKPYPSA